MEQRRALPARLIRRCLRRRDSEEDARARILQIHSRKMNVDIEDVNFEELARSTEDMNGAQLKAVCVEAGMLALRRDGTEVSHEDFNEGIIAVQAKKKSDLFYYA